MARLHKKNLSRPDELRPVGRGRLQVVDIGDTTVGRVRYEPGWRWSEDVKPIVGTQWCEIYHVGVVMSGRLRVEMNDGATIELGPDDVYEIPPGHDACVIGDEPWVSIDSVGRRYFGQSSNAAADRLLVTMLFTDLVASTEVAARLGDARWRDRLTEYQRHLPPTLERFRGRLIGTAGDGTFAVFDGPANAVRAALDMAQRAEQLGLAQRAGVHTGEVERAGDELRGIAVHLAARVAAAAGAGEILVTSTTHALLGGSGMSFASHGMHELKGIPQPVELLALDRSSVTGRPHID
ncbi:MAG TPA: adenylate/guanylate cyclase domain-containing protein [Candidatus Limnocylindrales bacterium]|nr:adenylate/guanylate cyclase domain-containing protein [Candidatus Limnocylindrales bacterium]